MRMRVLVAVAAVLALGACAGPPAPPSPTDPPPTALATANPEAEIERIIQLREDWGLRGDRAWVVSVGADPASVISELGIRVTPDEQAELERMMTEEPRSRLIAYGARHHDTFGGLWLEGGRVVMCFTADLASHGQATGQLARGMAVDVRPCRFTEAELKAVMRGIDFVALRAEGFELNSVGLDTINNVVRLEAKANDPTVKQRLEERYGGKLVAEIHPLPGPWQNAAEGPGWRLLGAGIRRDFAVAHTVAYAADEAAWSELWPTLDPASDRPAVAFNSEIVVVFVEGIGSSCPEVRLDAVVIDPGGRRIHSVTSDPLGPRNCTADLAGGAFFLVTVAREALPESPFTLSLRQIDICEACPDQSIVIDLR